MNAHVRALRRGSSHSLLQPLWSLHQALNHLRTYDQQDLGAASCSTVLSCRKQACARFDTDQATGIGPDRLGSETSTWDWGTNMANNSDTLEKVIAVYPRLLGFGVQG